MAVELYNASGIQQNKWPVSVVAFPVFAFVRVFFGTQT